jgi:hypothetical protein
MPGKSGTGCASIAEALEQRRLLSTYYVSPSGSDTNPGTQASPWQSVSRANIVNFKGGDSLLFQGGASFLGTQLYLDSADTGSAAAPIVIGSYGSGRATLGGTTGPGIYAFNTSGVSISNLNFVGTGATNTSGGILFYNNRTGNVKLPYIRIDAVDASKYQYGIEIGGGAGSSGFSDIRITNSSVHDNLRGGLFTFGATTNANTNVYVGHVKAYNNTGVAGLFAQSGIVTGHGIVLGSVNGGKIERSIAHDNGSLGDGGAGIWTYDSNNVAIQYNESYNNRTGGTHDGDGFDLDQNVSNSVMQYNYSHGNDGGGYLLAQRLNNSLHTNNVVRYNISANDGRRNNYGAIHLWGRIINAEIYANTVYEPAGVNGLHATVRIHNSGLLSTQAPLHVHFRNNVLQTTGGVPMIYISASALASASDLKFQGNDYWSTGSAFTINWGNSNYTSLNAFRATGQEKNGTTSTGLQVDPKLTTPTTVQTFGNADLLASLASYRLQSGSPMIGAGLNLTTLFAIATGGKDFWGDAAPAGGSFEIGADESTGATPPPPPPGFPIHVNFQPSTSPSYSGYLVDSGQTYAARGNGYTYGWNVDDSANTRDRNLAKSPDQRYDTLIHMQRSGSFSWNIAVPNGRYSVHIASGDAGFFDGVFRINAEGMLVVNGTPSSTKPWVEGTAIVNVSDGKLSLTSATGAVNNKICFIDISQAAALAPAAAAGGGAFTGAKSGGTLDPLELLA